MIDEFTTKSDEEKKPALTRQIIAPLKALNMRYDALLSAILHTSEQTNLPALSLLLRGELLQKKFANDGSVILYVKAIGGGENRTTQNLWSGGRLYHSGTAILIPIPSDSCVWFRVPH